MRPSAAAVTTSTGREPEHAARDTSGDAKYRGVRKRKWGKWVSEIRLPNSRERIWLGSYDSPEKAARAFDAALFCLRGNNANFNFPDQPPDIPGGTDLHPSQIQAVAAHFANSYPPGTSGTGTGTSTSTTSSSQLDHLHSHSDLIAMSTISSSSMELAQSASYMMEADNDNSNNYYIPDYGIYPGFDDYFMPVQPPPPVDHYDHYYESEEVVYDGVYSQDPSFLWNF